MVKRHRSVYLLILAISVAMLPGCGTTRKLVDKVMPGGGSGLKKRVMVTTPLDLASLGPQRIADIKQTFLGLLGQSSGVVAFPYESAIEASLANKPPFGPGAPKEIVDAASAANMNAILTWSLTPIETETRRSGIWPFRDTNRFYATSIIMNVVDVTLGAIISSEIKRREFSVPVDELEIGREASIDASLRNEIWGENLPELLEEQLDSVLEALGEAPWRCRLVSSEDGEIVIPAGENVGMEVGQVFSVFSKGSEVSATGGRNFGLMGVKIGRIEVTGVSAEKATFKALSDMNLEPGMIIQHRS